jgi:hypothetical protein
MQADASDDVTMTPSEIAQQNAPHIMNLQGLSLSPSPWAEHDASSAEDKKPEQQQRSKREMLAQQRREAEDLQQRKDASDQKYRSYMTMVATEERQARTQGDPMDPDALISALHTGMDLISGGGMGSILMNNVTEDAMKGGEEPGSQDTAAPRTGPTNQPLRND